jgi:hypothetical protein
MILIFNFVDFFTQFENERGYSLQQLCQNKITVIISPETTDILTQEPAIPL